MATYETLPRELQLLIAEWCQLSPWDDVTVNRLSLVNRDIRSYLMAASADVCKRNISGKYLETLLPGEIVPDIISFVSQKGDEIYKYIFNIVHHTNYDERKRRFTSSPVVTLMWCLVPTIFTGIRLLPGSRYIFPGSEISSYSCVSFQIESYNSTHPRSQLLSSLVIGTSNEASLVVHYLHATCEVDRFPSGYSTGYAFSARIRDKRPSMDGDVIIKVIYDPEHGSGKHRMKHERVGDIWRSAPIVEKNKSV